MGKLYNAYICSYHLNEKEHSEFFDLISDVYYTDEVQGLKIFPQHADINRLQHITSVAYLSYKIAKNLNLNVKKATRAAILHDLFYYDWHENDWSHRPHGYRHPGFALKNARILCKDLTKVEENAILRHMWPLTPTPPRYKEGFIVTFADKYCASWECLISYFSYFDKKFHKDKAMFKKGKINTN